MSENLCMSCTAACCKGPITMSLSPEEYDMMIAAGTDLRTIAEPADYERDDVPYPSGWFVDQKTGDPLRYEVDKDNPTEPLAAGIGRYTMFGTCGNLVTILGREQCGVYDTRPQVCQDFEVGGKALPNKCDLLRMLAQIRD